MPPLRDTFDRYRKVSLGAGLIGGLVCVVALFLNPRGFLQSYLVGYLFWWEITIGFLALALLRCVLRSNWGNATWPHLRAGLMTIPVMALLFLPIAFGYGQIYPWAGDSHETDAATLESDEAGSDAPEEAGVDGEHDSEHGHHENAFQEVYFEGPFFLGRAALYFLIWMLCGWVAARTGTNTGEARLPRRLASFGLMGLVLGTTFAAIDWGMSLEPEWYSTIYGALLLAGGVVGAMAILIISFTTVFRVPNELSLRVRQVGSDLGNLQLAFLMVWVYFAFSQYLIIWSGNLPTEVTWYLHRTGNFWQVVIILIVGFHFIVPFMLLLSREQKRSPRRLARVAKLLVLAHLIETIWTVAPSFQVGWENPTSNQLESLHWSLLVTPIAVGGFWVFAYCHFLKRILSREEMLDARRKGRSAIVETDRPEPPENHS